MGVTSYDPGGRRAAQARWVPPTRRTVQTAPASRPASSIQEYAMRRAANTKNLPAKTEDVEEPGSMEGGGGNIFSKGLGVVLNNPITKVALAPLNELDKMRRLVTLGIEEIAEGVSGQEMPRQVDPVTGELLDTRSNWDKINDPAFGIGQLMREMSWDNSIGNIGDKGVGFIGDAIADPLSYVGGLGFATRGAAAGGRAARAGVMSGLLNAARREGVEELPEVVAKLQRVGERGFAAADQEMLNRAGVRGGIRMNSNPLMPSRGMEATIRGSERVTQPLSAARTKVGEVLGRSEAGRRVLEWRTPDGLEDSYNRIFRGQGPETLEDALDKVAVYAGKTKHQGAFAAPLQAKADQLVHESRKMSASDKAHVLRQIETPNVIPTGKAAEFAEQFSDVRLAAIDEGLPIEYLENYATHIPTKDAIAWRRDSRNAGKIKAPTGFFTESVYDPSGVTMNRKFKIGDEFEVNGVPVKLEKATIEEVNSKFRAAGLNFDFFESDPGIILQKYINMVGDDVGILKATKELNESAGGRAGIFYEQRNAEGLPVTRSKPVTLPGGAKVAEGDLDEVAAKLGVEGGLDPDVYAVAKDKDLTKAANDPIKEAIKKEGKASRLALKNARQQIDTNLRLIAKGKVGWPGAPSLQRTLSEREATLREVSERVTALNKQLNDTKATAEQQLDRWIYHDDTVKEIQDEIAEIDLNREAFGAEAPKILETELRKQRRILTDKLEKAQNASANARRRIEKRQQFVTDFEDEIAMRRQWLYEQAGAEQPTAGTLQRSTPAPEPTNEMMGEQRVPQGHQAAALENKIANKLMKGQNPIEELRQHAALTGIPAPETTANLQAKVDAFKAHQTAQKEAKAAEKAALPVAKPVPARRKLTSSPETIDEIRRTAKEWQEQAVKDASDDLARRFGDGAEAGIARPGRTVTEQGAQDLYGNNPNVKVSDRASTSAQNEWFHPDSAIWNGRLKSRRWYIDKGWITPPNEGRSIDSLQESLAEFTGREYSAYGTAEAYFDNVDRIIAASNPKEITDPLVEFVAHQMGTDDLQGIRLALRNKGEFIKHVRLNAGADIDDVITEFDKLDDVTKASVLQVVREDPENAAQFLNDVVRDATGTNVRYEEALGSVDPNKLADYLGGNRAVEGAEPVSVPRTETKAPERIPSSQMADKYQELADLRAQLKTKTDRVGEMPGLERKLQETEAIVARIEDRLPLKDRAAMDEMFNARKQAMVDAAHAETDPDKAKEMLEQAKAMLSTDDVYAQYDAQVRKRAEIKKSIEKLKQETPGINKEIRILKEQEAKGAQYINERRQPVHARTVDQEGIDAGRARRQAEGRVHTIPSAETSGANPNLITSGVTGHGIDPAALAEGKRTYKVPEGEVRDAIQVQLERANKVITGKRSRVEQKMKQVAEHPKVTALKKRYMQSFKDAGGVTKSKVDVPDRPPMEFKNLSTYRRKEITEAEKLWTQQVDEITAGLPPMRGSYPANLRGPQGRQIDIALREAIADVSERTGLNQARKELAEAQEAQATIRSLLDTRINVGDDPASVARLSRIIRGMSDPGEFQTLLDMEKQVPAVRGMEKRLGAKDEAIIDARTMTESKLRQGVSTVEQQMDELATNPEARQAVEREALDQPLPQKLQAKSERLQRESNASATQAAMAQAGLAESEKSIVTLQAGMADIAARNIDEAKLVGETKGHLARVKKLDPKDRGNQPVESWLEGVLADDPGLKQIDNQATVFAINEAEKLAGQIQPILERVENSKLSANGEQMTRVLNVVLADTVSAMLPDLTGPNGPIIKDSLRRAMENTKRVTSDSAFWRHVDNLTGLFKTYATLSPGFHTRNAMSGAFMNASEGIAVADQARGASLARDYSRAMKDGKLDEFLAKQGKVVLDKKTGLTVRDAFDAVAGTGVGGRYREHGIGDRSLARNRINEKLYENALTYNVGKRPGSFIENSLRLPVALDTLKRGGSVEDAVNRITRVHFDYSQVSKFDQKMRRLIPFWTFMSRNLPLQMAQMYTKPRAFAKYNNFVRNFRGEGNVGEPEYFSKIGAFEWGDTKIAGLPMYLQPDLAHTRLEEDFTKIEDLLSLNQPSRLLSDFNPLATAPAEFMLGENFYTGKQYDDSDVRELGAVEKPIEILAKLFNQTKETPGGKTVVNEKFVDMIRSLVPVYDRSVRLAPSAVTGSSDEDAKARQVESYLRFIGIPVRQLSEAQQRSTIKGQEYDLRDQRDLQRTLALIDQGAA